ASDVAANVPAIIRRSSVSRVHISIYDCSTSCTVDAEVLKLRILDPCDRPIYYEDYFETYVAPAEHRIVKVPNVPGQYYIEWGDLDGPAMMTGVITLPTGFVGGERLQLLIDQTLQTVTFDVADQTLEQV